jgi:signal transduction histidine kinase
MRATVAPNLGPMDSDRRRVDQVLLNLLNNAIKFTEHGSISLLADVVELLAGQARPAVRIQIVDTGIGMRREDMTHLFQPFRQIDSGLQREHEGTGLGLAICRRLTGLLGGTIQVDSEPGKGSTFTVTLPLGEAANGGAKKGEEMKQSMPGRATP